MEGGRCSRGLGLSVQSFTASLSPRGPCVLCPAALRLDEGSAGQDVSDLALHSGGWQRAEAPRRSGGVPAGEMPRHPRVFGVHAAPQGTGVGMAWTGPKEEGGAGAFWHFLSEQSRHRLPEPVSGWSLRPPRTLPPRGLGGSRGCRARRLQSAPACPRPSHPRIPFSLSLAPASGVSFPRGGSSRVLSGVALCWARGRGVSRGRMGMAKP